MNDVQGQVDTLSSVMDEAGDKMVTNSTGTPNTRPRKGGKSGGPCARVKSGSASVPIYLSQSKGRTRYFLCYHRDGKRMRQTFTDLATAKKEGQFVAQRIQAGMQHVDRYPGIQIFRSGKLPLLLLRSWQIVARRRGPIRTAGVLARHKGTRFSTSSHPEPRDAPCRNPFPCGTSRTA